MDLELVALKVMFSGIPVYTWKIVVKTFVLAKRQGEPGVFSCKHE